jgi:subtilase family serine protease
MVFGGTSVASPSLAGIVNLAGAAGGFYSNSNAELTTIYQNMTNSSDFRDITSGTAGSYTAGPGWDYVTGVGSDQALSGK